MNKRERFLLFTLLGLLICVGGFGMYYFFYRKPMDTLQQRLATANADVNSRNQELDGINKELDNIDQRDPHLALWQKISLPEAKVQPGKPKTPDEIVKHLSQVQVDYERYLSDLLRTNGFDPRSITVTPRPVDSKSSPVLPGKGPIYTKLQFAVQGQANLAAIVKTLNQFHRDSLLQQVNQLSITKPGTGRQGANPADLDVSMSIEALLVNGAEVRDELKPTLTDKPRVLAEPKRNYDEIWMAKNIFLGSQRQTSTSASAEERNQVLGAVRLTTISNNGRRWEAYLYDLAKGGDERMLTVSTKPDFTIKDRFGNEVLSGKVVLIDDRVLVFQSKSKYYKLTAGDFLYPAIDKPLKDEELKDLGLTPSAAPAPDAGDPVKSPVLTTPASSPD